MPGEEDDLDVTCASDVPESRRLVSTDATVDVQRKQADLELNRSPISVDETPRLLVKWGEDDMVGGMPS